MIRPLLIAALALPLLAAKSDPLAGRVAGAPVNCISLPTSQGPAIVDSHTILYTQGARVWKTGPVGACPSLAPLTTLVVDVYGGQLCKNDRFRVITPGLTIPSAYCRCTEFTPYGRVKK